MSTNFYLSAVCIFILQIQPSTTSHTIWTSTPYFVFPGLYILNFRQPHHRIVASSSHSSLGCKLTWISVENVHTEAIFWIPSLRCVFPGLFCDSSHTVHYFLPLTVLALALVKSVGQIEIIYMEELWGRECHCPKFQLHHHQTSQYVSARNSRRTSYSFIIVLCKVTVCIEGSDDRKKRGASECMVAVLQLYGSENVGSRRVCMFVTWDPNILLQNVDNLDMKSDTEQLRNTCIECWAWQHRYMWPINNAWHSNCVFIRGPMAEC